MDLNDEIAPEREKDRNKESERAGEYTHSEGLLSATQSDTWHFPFSFRCH